MNELVNGITGNWTVSIDGVPITGEAPSSTNKIYVDSSDNYYRDLSLQFDFETGNTTLSVSAMDEILEDVFLELADIDEGANWTLISKKPHKGYFNKKFKYGFRTKESAWIKEFNIFVKGTEEGVTVYVNSEFALDFVDEIEEAVDKVLMSPARTILTGGGAWYKPFVDYSFTHCTTPLSATYVTC